MSALLLWGAGGHGKVVLDCALMSAHFSPIAFLDDAPGVEFRAHKVLGGRDQVPSATHLGFSVYLVSIGNNRVRACCFEMCGKHGLQPVTIVHPSAIISQSAAVSPGTVVMPRAVINAGSVIGNDCIINTGAIVEHDCRIGDHVHISPGVLLGGAVTVRDYAHIGIGAIILPGIEIGEGAMVGAGAVVRESVPVGVTVVGIPARSLVRKAISSEL